MLLEAKVITVDLCHKRYFDMSEEVQAYSWWKLHLTEGQFFSCFTVWVNITLNWPESSPIHLSSVSYCHKLKCVHSHKITQKYRLLESLLKSTSTKRNKRAVHFYLYLSTTDIRSDLSITNFLMFTEEWKKSEKPLNTEKSWTTSINTSSSVLKKNIIYTTLQNFNLN